MNTSRRDRAEMLIVLQECGIHTDSQTLEYAAWIAQHDRQFQCIKDPFLRERFSQLAEMFREKVACGCRKCKTPEALAHLRGRDG